MLASVPQTLFSSFEPLILKVRVRKLKCILHNDLVFWVIWRGGVLPFGTHLALNAQVSIDARGRLRYYGRLYDQRTWSWQPPKVVRLQGRGAKEYPSDANRRPTDWTKVDDVWVGILRRCDECNGDLVYEPDRSLYCSECGLQAI